MSFFPMKNIYRQKNDCQFMQKYICIVLLDYFYKKIFNKSNSQLIKFIYYINLFR